MLEDKNENENIIIGAEVLAKMTLKGFDQRVKRKTNQILQMCGDRARDGYYHLVLNHLTSPQDDIKKAVWSELKNKGFLVIRKGGGSWMIHWNYIPVSHFLGHLVVFWLCFLPLVWNLWPEWGRCGSGLALFLILGWIVAKVEEMGKIG